MKKRKTYWKKGVACLLASLILLLVTLIFCRVQEDKEATAIQSKSKEQKTEETAVEEKPVTITISATGDCTFASTQLRGYAGSFHEYYDKYGPAYFMEKVKPIFEKDSFTLVNLECALSDSSQRVEKEFMLVGKPEYAQVLSEGAIEGVSLANNHSLDALEQGLQDTIDAVSGQQVGYAYYDQIGTFQTEEGIVIGYVSSSLLSQGADREQYLQQGIQQLKEEKVDLIIACCHWGVERTYEPTEYQKRMAHQCVDWGADLVIGNHPHVIQGIECYQGKMICYSLGNFSFGGNGNPADKRTMIYQQQFTFVDGVLQEESRAKIIPCRISGTSAYNDYQPTPVEGTEKEELLDALREYSAPLSQISFDQEGNIQK